MDFPDLAQSPRRVVSLVPSMTESLFELGFGSSVIGVTDYCNSPAEKTSGLPRVGGPKNVDLGCVLSLSPDLIIANQEENSRAIVESMIASGLPVWVTFPKTVRESLDDLWTLARAFRSKSAALQLRLLEDSLKLTELGMAETPTKRYFCPIWQDIEPDGTMWWMTFNRETYSNDLLRILGGENVFSDRTRRYPLAANLGFAAAEETGERDVRYPIVTAADIQAAGPEIILLPSEPYDFQPADLQRMMALFPDAPAVKDRHIHRLDGSLVTWHGTHLGQSLSTLPQFFS
ncbi:helical backbone metal receptor [Longilinea arvoryzae]|uniref:helical backbone metal receptor n=1 Tax=Longilinea arvoryzae TaxID=360412 RepID=UPI0012601C53|nr:helical backbone metal receptor [Longilinea arvoryzae]